MSEESNVVSVTEYGVIGKAMLERIAAYTSLPTGAVLDYQAVNGIGHIGYISLPGGKYLREDVYGGFEAQLNFQIAYMIAGTGNSEMLAAETFLDGLTEWLEQKPFPVLTGGRSIQRITFDSTTHRSQAAADGSLLFVRNGQVRYEKY